MSGRSVIRVPGDKSISHRALILGALSSGTSRIRGILRSADIESTASVLRALGVKLPALTDDFRVQGVGLRGLKEPASALQAGNSGTTVRLMAGVVAAHEFSSRFEGDSSLSARPMKRISDPLSEMGARIEFERDDGLPMTVHGWALTGMSWNTRAASAQTKSAILLAGLAGGVPVTVRESRKSRDHTERMLASMGVPVSTDDLTVSISPVDSIGPLDIEVPGDPSSAAYFIALAVLGAGEIEIPGMCVNHSRIGFLDVLKAMGAEIECTDKVAIAGDSAATVVARPSRLSPTGLDPDLIPRMIDELPLLACVAAAAGIDLEVTGAGELRVKESDRIASVVTNLRAIGADAEELPDGFRIRSRRGPLSGRVSTRGDHRIAMSFGILGALRGNEIEIDDPDCVDVSYPRFWADLAALTS
ncbi:MAG: 3-phosphoshikimate 1-carboxyvinyltransferase [Gemmatimonadaceae bacterium]